MKIHFQTYAISGIYKGRYFKHREGTYIRVFMMYLYNSYMIKWKIEQWNFARFVTLYPNKEYPPFCWRGERFLEGGLLSNIFDF